MIIIFISFLFIFIFIKNIRLLIQEMKDLIIHALKFFHFEDNSYKFEDFFSQSFYTTLYLTLNGDVYYIPYSKDGGGSKLVSISPSQTFKLFNLNPVETSKSHILALSLACHAIIFTEKGYNGIAESEQYYPIGCFSSPIGSWGLVTSSNNKISTSPAIVALSSSLLAESSSTPISITSTLISKSIDTSNIIINEFLLSLVENFSKWLTATYNFRIGSYSAIELDYMR